MSRRPSDSSRAPGAFRRITALWRVELARGMDLFAAGDEEGARAAWARAHVLGPDEPEPALALGRVEARRGRWDVAERLLRMAHERRPTWPAAAAALARLLAQRARPNRQEAVAAALSIVERALAADTREALLLLVQGELHLDAERPAAAARSFEVAREAGAEADTVNAGLARVANLEAIALVGDGRVSEAAFAFKRACDLDPRWAPPRANLGALWQRLGRWRQAAEQYRQALMLDPTHGLASFNLGLLHREQGEWDQAARAFAAALTAEPPHPEARVELALALSARGEHTHAALLLEETLQVPERRSATLYTHLGVAHARAGEQERARAAWEAALALDAAHAPALRHLASCHARAGRLVDAAALLERANAGNRGLPPASA